MRLDRTLIGLLSGAAAVSVCTLPTDPLPNTITSPFSVQVQNISYPDVHDFYMNLLQAGGGDQHLFIGPVGVPTKDLTLNQRSLTQSNKHANNNGEVCTAPRDTAILLLPAWIGVVHRVRSGLLTLPYQRRSFPTSPTPPKCS